MYHMTIVRTLCKYECAQIMRWQAGCFYSLFFIDGFAFENGLDIFIFELMGVGI